MNEFLRASNRIGFAGALIVAWLGVTPIVAWTAQRTGTGIYQWIGLWFFAVAAPTIEALRVRRALRKLTNEHASLSERVNDDLGRTPILLVLYGNMTVLTIFALELAR